MTIKAAGLMTLLGMISLYSHAGCIGPVIMGECKGAVVPYDTHHDGISRQPAPYGYYYDKRGSQYARDHFGKVNPFTGFDPHDANPALYEQQQAKERACLQLRMQDIHPMACR